MSLLGAALQALVEPSRQLGLPSLPRRLLDVIVPAQVNGRPAWAADGRAVISARGLHLPESVGFIRELEDTLEAHEAVVWARVNAPLGRIIVGLDGEACPLAELVEVVDEIERRHFSESAPPHAEGDAPLDAMPAERAGLELVAGLAGIASAVAARALGARPVGPELAAAISMVDSTPRLRGFAERALGASTADAVLAILTAAVQALAQGFLGLAVDLAQRGLILAEARSESLAWQAARSRYLSTAASSAAGPLAVERPQELEQGPVERWADTAGVLGLSTFGVALPATGNGWHAAGIALSAVPKPGRTGREAFAAQLGRIVSRRGGVVLDPGVLRQLDRIRTVVVDGSVLATGRYLLGTVLPLASADREDVAERIYALFDGAEPEGIRTDGEWSLGPAQDLQVTGPRGVREVRRLVPESRTPVLGLAKRSRLMAVASVVPQPHSHLQAISEASRASGRRLVVFGGAENGLTGEQTPPGETLWGAVRRLQAEGGGVLLLSRDRQALANADVGLGVDDDDEPPPWGADILVPPDLSVAALLIESCAAAASVSTQSVAVSRAGAVIGGLAAGLNRQTGSASRSMLAVNVAAALSLLLGVRAAVRLDRRPRPPAAQHVPWHAMPVETVLEQLETAPEGLDPEEASLRQGRTDHAVPQRVSFTGAVIEELDNPLTPILGFGTAISVVLGGLIDAALIAGVTLLSAVLGGGQRQHTDQALRELLAQSVVVARIHRNGEEMVVPSHDLVPGDIVHVAAGDVVPADCRIIEAFDVEVDESSLTGEPFPVAKGRGPVIADTPAERTSMLYEGTTIAAGRAHAAVVATGSSTEAGQGAAAAGAQPQTGGVERRLAAITDVTLPITLASAGTLVVSGMARGFGLRETAGAGVSLAVAAVPEGLPFLVTAAQLASARRLSAQGTLVRNPRTIEALGRVDVLCFDKTGTLTEGRIRLGAVCGEDGGPVDLGSLDRSRRAVLGAGLRATPEKRGDRKLEHFTDRAVAKGARRADVDRKESAPGWEASGVLPFEPARGYHAALGYSPGERILSVKGAPEILIPLCSHSLRGARRLPLDARDRHRLARRMDRLAHDGYRVLAVAERRDPRHEGAEHAPLTDEDVRALTFLGFLALTDPVRDAAAQSIEALQGAGVRVLMITGDHPGTATAVARRLSLPNGSQVITGAELDRLDDRELEEKLPHVAVVARGTPAHKLRVVKAFQRLGRTVAMTGDGANDAPAIRLADVGIALGSRSSPAARAAADLVVTDDQLETITSALVEGRSLWGSVREALGIMVGGNLGEVAFTVVGSLLRGLSPLGTRQLLLVNLLTDLAPALAIALRPPRAASIGQLLSEGPERSLGSALTHEISRRAVVTATGAAAAWAAAAACGLGAAAAQTVALAGLVGSQLAQTLFSGTPSRGVVGAALGSAAALFAVIQQPALSVFFGSTPLPLLGWIIAGAACLGAVVLAWILSESGVPLRDALLRRTSFGRR
ncbi:cation-translocating P-type ATPase [Sinomonas mesophila]|uniref:cation-translocating P-type ATPase n=1 Tax=Sinomonas mesophila TaxID=1531955 RepID=UPI00098703CB|nr:HAD-IC family P-type ATPase [Sinomonas mesophila]